MKCPFPNSFPWATLGRRESRAELFHQWGMLRAQVQNRTGLPRFRIWVRGQGAALHQTVESLLWQSYPHWEAIGEGADWEALCRETGDDRLKGARAGEADWTTSLEEGVVLSPVALSLFHAEARRAPHARVLYCNHIELGASPTFIGKPEPSSLTLLHFNYVGSSFFFRGPGPETWGPTAIHRWLLGLDPKEQHLCPFYLFYYPQSRPLLSSDLAQALETEIVARVGKATVRSTEAGLKISPTLETRPTVSVLIPFRDKVEWTLRCVKSLVDQAREVDVDLVLVNNGSRPDSIEKLEQGLGGVSYRLVSVDGPFDYARMNNTVVRQYARGDLVLFLNNDVALRGAGSLDEMARWAVQPQVGTVGILLRYPDGSLQHDGIRGVFGGESRMARVGHFSRSTPFVSLTREVFANTFAACMVRKSTFEKVGGLREWEMNNGFGDVAFNLECRRLGLGNLFLGHVEAVHEESGSRGMTYEYWEEFFLERDYSAELQKMLRADLTWNRVPARSTPLELLGDLVRRGVRAGLGPARPWIKKGLRTLSLKGDTRALP